MHLLGVDLVHGADVLGNEVALLLELTGKTRGTLCVTDNVTSRHDGLHVISVDRLLNTIDSLGLGEEVVVGALENVLNVRVRALVLVDGGLPVDDRNVHGASAVLLGGLVAGEDGFETTEMGTSAELVTEEFGAPLVEVLAAQSGDKVSAVLGELPHGDTVSRLEAGVGGLLVHDGLTEVVDRATHLGEGVVVVGGAGP